MSPRFQAVLNTLLLVATAASFSLFGGLQSILGTSTGQVVVSCGLGMCVATWVWMDTQRRQVHCPHALMMGTLILWPFILPGYLLSSRGLWGALWSVLLGGAWLFCTMVGAIFGLLLS